MVTSRIGIDSFSYHRFFGEVTTFEQPVDETWTTLDFLEHAVDLGVDIVSLQTAYISDAERRTLPQTLNRLGLTVILSWGHPVGLDGGTDETLLDSCREMMAYAKSIDCDVLRFITGNQFSGTVPQQTRMERLRPMIKRLALEAENVGIDLAWENHADFSVMEIVRTIEDINSQRLGICFDIANSFRVGDDILEAVVGAAPYIRMLHCRDIIPPKDRSDPSAFWAAVPLGKGELPLAEFFPLVLGLTESLPYFVELTNLHPDFKDEQSAVAESLQYLRNSLC